MKPEGKYTVKSRKRSANQMGENDVVMAKSHEHQSDIIDQQDLMVHGDPCQCTKGNCLTKRCICRRISANCTSLCKCHKTGICDNAGNNNNGQSNSNNSDIMDTSNCSNEMHKETKENGNNNENEMNIDLGKFYKKTRIVVSEVYTQTLLYEEIPKNIYLCHADFENHWDDTCNCQAGTKCGKNCLNRLSNVECSVGCVNGPNCSNKRFQLRNYVSTEVFFTSDNRGWGLRTKQRIPKNCFIMEYVGEIIGTDEARLRMELYAHNSNHFMMKFKKSQFLDATLKGNKSRFINHSCEPNSQTEKWTVNNQLCIGFFANRSIEAEEEITVDYMFERYGKEVQECFCRSKKCRIFLSK